MKRLEKMPMHSYILSWGSIKNPTSACRHELWTFQFASDQIVAPNLPYRPHRVAFGIGDGLGDRAERRAAVSRGGRGLAPCLATRQGDHQPNDQRQRVPLVQF